MLKFFLEQWKTFKAEWLKLKGSGMIWLCLIAAAFIPVLQTLISSFSFGEFDETTKTNPWENFFFTSYRGFGSFFFPVFLVLIIVRLTQIEHRNNTWKLIETQPVKRLSLFIAKWNTGILLSLCILIGVFLFSLLGGGILAIISPKSGFGKFAPDIFPIIKIIVRLWIAGMGLMALQYLLALWIPNFFVNFGIGLMSIIVGLIISAFGVADWWPYSAPNFTLTNINGSQTGKFLLHHEWQSLLWAALFLWIGYEFFVNKGWRYAFFKPAKKSLKPVLPIAAFAALMWLVNKPIELKPYSKTVIAGSIKGGNEARNIILYGQPLRDTILMIPVIKNQFHLVVDKKIGPQIYILRYGIYNMQLFFGDKDSVYADITIKDKNPEIKVGGTRAAENAILNKREEFAMQDYFLENYAYEYKPNTYANMALSAWRKKVENLQKYKTVDNIKPAADFIELRKKLLAVEYLKYINISYPKMFAVYYPNQELKYPDRIKELLNAVNINDSTLVSDQTYRDYLLEYYRYKSGLYTNRNDSLYFSYIIDSLQKGKVRDVILYDLMSKAISQIPDSAKRERLLANFISAISQPPLQQKLIGGNATMNHLQRGKPAFNFTGEAITGNNIQLAELRGRFVVIDVWATWCDPCQKESPYFERLAEEYGGKQIAFVSVSIDAEKSRWRSDVPQRSQRVLQIWADSKNAESFSRDYNIEFIPRFMLISPDGKILSAQMPPPSDPRFEAILQQEISLSNIF